MSFGLKCIVIGCWNYTLHRSGMCKACREHEKRIRTAIDTVSPTPSEVAA